MSSVEAQRKDSALKAQSIGLAVCWIGAAILLVVFRLHAFDLPLEGDEGNYAYIGSRLLAGDKLYVDVWDHQPPGVFALFAVVSAFLGDSPAVYRWVAVAFSLTTLGLVYAILHRTAGRFAAVSAAFLFAIVSSDPGSAGEGCNREIYMNTLILAAWAFALWGTQVGRAAEELDSDDRDSTWRSSFRRSAGWLAAGAALAVASLMKTVVAVHWVALVVMCVVAAIRQSRITRKWRSFAIDLSTLSLAPALVWSGTTLYFMATERWAEFYDAVFGFNLEYSQRPADSTGRFIEFFTPRRAPFIFESLSPLWWAAAVSTIVLIIDSIKHRKEKAAWILLLLSAGYVAVCLPGQFWPHYFYLLVPPMVIVVAWSLDRLIGISAHRASQRFPALEQAGRGLAFGLVIATAFVWQYRHYLGQPVSAITARRYQGRDYWAQAQGANVRRTTKPDDEIFVYGNDASIYYYSARRCASRFTMITALHSRFVGSEKRRRIMLDEIRRRRPRLILILLGEETFPEWAQDFLPKNYEPVGWDFRDFPPHDPVLMVLADRERPVVSIDWEWNSSQLPR